MPPETKYTLTITEATAIYHLLAKLEYTLMHFTKTERTSINTVVHCTARSAAQIRCTLIFNIELDKTSLVSATKI